MLPKSLVLSCLLAPSLLAGAASAAPPTNGPCSEASVASVLELKEPSKWTIGCEKLAGRSYVAAAFAPTPSIDVAPAIVRVAVFTRDGRVTWRTEERIEGNDTWRAYRESFATGADQFEVALDAIGGKAKGIRVSLLGAFGEDAFNSYEVMIVYRRAASGDAYERVLVAAGDHLELASGDCVEETTHALRFEKRDVLVIDVTTAGPGRGDGCVRKGKPQRSRHTLSEVPAPPRDPR